MPDLHPSGGTVQGAEVCPNSIHQVEQFKERNDARLISIERKNSRSEISLNRIYQEGHYMKRKYARSSSIGLKSSRT